MLPKGCKASETTSQFFRHGAALYCRDFAYRWRRGYCIYWMGVSVKRLRIVVVGALASMPYAGMAWMHMQIAVGLPRLGHDVYYMDRF